MWSFGKWNLNVLCVEDYIRHDLRAQTARTNTLTNRPGNGGFSCVYSRHELLSSALMTLMNTDDSVPVEISDQMLS